MFYINPGELRTKIRIQKPMKTGTGSFALVSWLDVCTVSSRWEALKSAEKWTADSLQAVGGATVTVRYNAEITEQCRIVYEGNVYQIVDIGDPTQKKQWLQITVKAAVNG